MNPPFLVIQLPFNFLRSPLTKARDNHQDNHTYEYSTTSCTFTDPFDGQSLQNYGRDPILPADTDISAFGRASQFNPEKIQENSKKMPAEKDKSIKVKNHSARSVPLRKVSYKRSSSPMAERLALWREKASEACLGSPKYSLKATDRCRSMSVGSASLRNLRNSCERNSSTMSSARHTNAPLAIPLDLSPKERIFPQRDEDNCRPSSPIAERLALWRTKTAAHSGNTIMKKGSEEEGKIRSSHSALDLSHSNEDKLERTRHNRGHPSPQIAEKLKKWRAHSIRIPENMTGKSDINHLKTSHLQRTANAGGCLPSKRLDRAANTRLAAPSPVDRNGGGRRSMSPLIASRIAQFVVS